MQRETGERNKKHTTKCGIRTYRMIDKKINKRTYIKSKTKRRDTNADKSRQTER